LLAAVKAVVQTILKVAVAVEQEDIELALDLRSMLLLLIL
tara:strand:+ start:139 stop:258 length:120 start_codon:yes stop_codon:yes gene_type:complete